ncbi:hypothetical protein GCM10011314_00550 [Knoellia flava]|uniref:Uncharacterized protein n=1 Tax=Knoellia flava TaxID=913969 RepID=A0A8H9FRB8_9MICO|nr:hypothetical protein GCM10011314_00550 [Knoellia flava]
MGHGAPLTGWATRGAGAPFSVTSLARRVPARSGPKVPGADTGVAGTVEVVAPGDLDEDGW